MHQLTARTLQLLLDLAILSIAYWVSFWLRFEGSPPKGMFKTLILSWPYVVGLKYLLMMRLGINRFSWRFIGLREINRIFAALALPSLLLLLLRLSAPALLSRLPYAVYMIVPLSVITLDFAFSFMGISGVRVLRRLAAERARTRKHTATTPSPSLPTLLIGAGEAGLLVAKEIAARPDLAILPVGFVDDDSRKRGTVVHGIPVLGSSAELPSLVAQLSIKQLIITISNAPGSEIRRLTQICKASGLSPKILPGVHELIGGRVSLSRLRDVSVEDLLRRAPVLLETPLIEAFITNKRILITGAGGSIGSELCRQVARFKPSSLLLVERSEFHLFSIHMELTASFPDLHIAPLICDICDADRVRQIFQDHSPHVVFHAAAHKHVPMMEINPGEAIKNNIFGTQTVAEAANRAHAEAFVLISTDKAVNPTSVMGATKRVAELTLQALSQRAHTKLVAVRFGNVLGSTGSVIPIFKKQIADGGPVTITHPEMRRYFMTIPEAAQLVMQAAAMGKGGEIFALDMGEPVKIKDLAFDLIRMSGLEPERDIQITYSGARPGEKLFEELGFDAERMNKTRHPQIYVGKLHPVDPSHITSLLHDLLPLSHSSDRARARAALAVAVPEMLPDATSPQDTHQDTPQNTPPHPKTPLPLPFATTAPSL